MNTLDNLDTIASEADAGAIALDPVAQAEAQAAANAPDFGQEATIAVDMFAGLLCGFAPKCESIWTTQAKDRTAKALAPVLQKYEITMDKMPVELGLVIVAGPLLWQSSKVVAAQIEADRRAKPIDAQAREAKPAPESGEAPAAPVHPQTALYS